MKPLLILLTVIFFSFSQAMSQPVLDHIAIYVTDLKKSSAFYGDVLGLDPLPEPFHDGKHAWFAIGPGNQLHIIEGATNRAEQPKRNHTCFRIASLQEFIIRLTKAGIAYEDLEEPVRLVPRFDKVFVSRDPGQPKHWLIGPYSDLAQIRDGLGTWRSRSARLPCCPCSGARRQGDTAFAPVRGARRTCPPRSILKASTACRGSLAPAPTAR